MKRCVSLAATLVLALAPALHAEGFGFVDLINVQIGLGSALPQKPNQFENDYKPGFGLLVDVGAQKGIVEAALDLGFDFYLIDDNTSITPDDANTFTVFLTFRVKPLETAARPYILFGGGYYRYWIVNQNHYENVLGYAGGAGVEVDISKSQRLFLEGRYLQGRTRDNVKKANTETIPIRFGLMWVFK